MAKLICRGPRIQDISIFDEPVTRNADHTLSEALVRAIRRRQGEKSAKKASNIFKDVRERDGVTDDLISLCFKRGQTQLASLIDKKSRDPCGYDLTEKMESYPIDGEPKTMECPSCGQDIGFRRGTPPIKE